MADQRVAPYTVHEDGTITDPNGLVAIRHKNQANLQVICRRPDGAPPPRDVAYTFLTRSVVCLGWVDPQDVSCVTSKLGGCCGKKSPNVFWKANELDVRLWLGLGR